LEGGKAQTISATKTCSFIQLKKLDEADKEMGKWERPGGEPWKPIADGKSRETERGGRLRTHTQIGKKTKV